GALVGVGEAPVHGGSVGRAWRARQELLAAVDDRLVRRGIVPPGMPGTRRDAEQVGEAEGLCRLHALRAELHGAVEGRAAIEEPPAGLAPDGGVTIAGELRERLARSLAVAAAVAREGDRVACAWSKGALRVGGDETVRHRAERTGVAGGDGAYERRVVRSLVRPRDRRIVDRPAPGLLARCPSGERSAEPV